MTVLITEFEPRQEALTIDDVEITAWSYSHWCDAYAAAGIDRRTGNLSSILVFEDGSEGWAWAADCDASQDHWIGGGGHPPLTLGQAMLEAEDAVFSRYDYEGMWQRPGLPEAEIVRRQAKERAAFENFCQKLSPRRILPESVVDLSEIRRSRQ